MPADKITLRDFTLARFERTEPTRIFVYGMLLPTARESATLPGHRLAFDGFATVIEDDDGRVLGGIIETDAARPIAYYDRIEGVDPRHPDDPHGLYRREVVELADGSFAWVYKMNRAAINGAGFTPSPFYLDTVREGYLKHGYDPSEVDAAVAA